MGGVATSVQVGLRVAPRLAVGAGAAARAAQARAAHPSPLRAPLPLQHNGKEMSYNNYLDADAGEEGPGHGSDGNWQ